MKIVCHKEIVSQGESVTGDFLQCVTGNYVDMRRTFVKYQYQLSNSVEYYPMSSLPFFYKLLFH